VTTEPILAVGQQNSEGYYPVRYLGRDYYLLEPFQEGVLQDEYLTWQGIYRPGLYEVSLGLRFRLVPEAPAKPKKTYATAMGLRRPGGGS